MALKGDATKIIDLEGATLMPSFIDAHGHFMNAPQIVKWANVSGVPAGPVGNIPDIIEVLTAHKAKFNLEPGDWIIGYGYDMTNLAEGRQLTRDDLDPTFPDNPLMLIHSSNHGCVLNSAGFKAVGIDASTKTPPGGVILRKAGSEEPEGLLMETAFLPIFAKMPQPSEAELLDTLDAAQQIYASVGITTAQEGATHATDLAFLRKGAEQGRFYLDIVSLPLFLEVPKLVAEYFPEFKGGPMSVPDTASESFGVYKNRLKLGGVKFALDGSPQGKTAFWSKPLLTPGPEGEKDWRGAPVFPPELINKAVGEAYKKNIPVFCHCNGDAAIDMMIDAAKLAGVKADQDRRTVIVHSQFMRPEQLDSYVELGFSPSFFTVHTFFWGDVHLENLGAAARLLHEPDEVGPRQKPHMLQPQRLLGHARRADADGADRRRPRVAQRSCHRPRRAGRRLAGAEGADDRAGVANPRGERQGHDRRGQARRPRHTRRRSDEGPGREADRHQGRRDLQGRRQRL